MNNLNEMLDNMTEEEASLVLLEGLKQGPDGDKLIITKVFDKDKLIYAQVFDTEKNEVFFEIKTQNYENIRIER